MQITNDTFHKTSWIALVVTPLKNHLVVDHKIAARQETISNFHRALKLLLLLLLLWLALPVGPLSSS